MVPVTPHGPDAPVARRQEGAQLRRWSRALTFVSAVGSVLVAPPVLGPLVAPDGEINVGLNWFVLWCCASVGAAVAVAAAWTWLRGGGWLVALRRRWRLAAAMSVTAVALGGWAVGWTFHRRNHPDWRDVVDLGYPELAAVSRALAAGDDAGADRESPDLRWGDHAPALGLRA